MVDIDIEAGMVTEETMDDILHMESESGGGSEAERLLGPETEKNVDKFCKLKV